MTLEVAALFIPSILGVLEDISASSLAGTFLPPLSVFSFLVADFPLFWTLFGGIGTESSFLI